MAEREQRPGRVRRLLGWTAELMVVVLLAAAGASLHYDLGARWLGLERADPVTAPAAVPPPEGLELPVVPAAAPVAVAAAQTRVDAARVAATVRPLLRRGVLGPHVGVVVTDLSTGETVFRSGAATVTPASTMKLMTGAAALESLGPMARFTTTARFDAASGQLVLVGGGDPFLASSPGAAPAYPARADLATLAGQAASALAARGVTRVRLGFDDSLFTGPAVNPAWRATYLPVEVSPIGSLWVDGGRLLGGGYAEEPPVEAARVFAAALRDAGVAVRPRITRAVAPATATPVASVASAPLSEIVERILAVSDNRAAEVLARHVGLAERQEGSFTAGAGAVLDVVRRLGVPTDGDRLLDGSGLSRDNLVSPATLTGVLQAAASPEHPDLRAVLTGLPIAGYTGSLAYRFDDGPEAALGRVRAKTGTLTGVHALAGVTDDVDGGQMAFAIVADRVPPPKSLEAQLLVDRVAAALGACRCGLGS